MSVELELGRALLGAGLPINPARTVGKNFIFSCERDSGRYIIAGTIMGMQLSDSGIYFFVSVPEIFGQSLHYIYYRNGRGDRNVWGVKIKNENDPLAWFRGELKILESA